VAVIHLPQLGTQTMMYLLAIVLPPLAVLLAGKPIQCLLNCVLILFFWIPGVVHALFVVADSKANKRNKDLINAMRR
jgi:uncharacterized membrane protein YqaE (UPF0057 family)